MVCLLVVGFLTFADTLFVIYYVATFVDVDVRCLDGLFVLFLYRSLYLHLIARYKLHSNWKHLKMSFFLTQVKLF